MKKHLLFFLLVIVTSGCRTVDSNASHQSISGAWELVRWEDNLPGEDPSYPFGEHPRGMVIYDPKGYMSVQVTKERRPTSQSEMLESYFAYVGRYEIDWTNHIATFTVEMGLQGLSSGQVFKVPFNFEGDLLTLMPHFKTENGKEASGIRVFKKR